MRHLPHTHSPKLSSRPLKRREREGKLNVFVSPSHEDGAESCWFSIEKINPEKIVSIDCTVFSSADLTNNPWLIYLPAYHM